MEPENLNQEVSQAEQPSSLHQVTPLSKYLAMALFVILPFVGGYIGYVYAPDKVVEVEKEVIISSNEVDEMSVSKPPESIDVVENVTDRVLLSRTELIEKEIELMDRFGIAIEGGVGTAPLYWMEDKNIEGSTVLFDEKGLRVLLPYNAGWGSPYYQLTPYDVNDTRILFGQLNPCPAGCAGSGAFIGYQIEIHSKEKTLEEIVNKHSTLKYNPEYCETITLNEGTRAEKCWSGGASFVNPMVITGSKYKYEFINWPCQDDLRSYQERSTDEFSSQCLVLNQSIQVE